MTLIDMDQKFIKWRGTARRARTQNKKIRYYSVKTALAVCALLLFLLPGCLKADIPESNLKRMNALYQKSKLQFPEAPEISAEELMERMKKETVVLVDNREEDERAVSMLPGAISVQEFEDTIASYSGTTVVVYCTIGERSGHYTKKLRKQDIDAYNLKGGVLAWAHAGGTFVDGQGNTTNLVHVYGPRWNLLPDGYEAVW